jgi:tetratricopeptide (TPR) repeat protein
VTVKQRRWLLNGVLIASVLALLIPALLPLLQPNRPLTVPVGDVPQTGDRAQAQAQAQGFAAVLAKEPNNQTALRGLIEARLKLGDLPGVIDPLEKLAKLNPGVTAYRVLLAQAKQQVGDREGSAQIYRSILDLKPGDVAALRGLVSLQLQQNRPNAAIGLLQDTLAKAAQPSNGIDVPSVQLILAQVYVQQKQYPDALKLYDQISKGNPKDFRPVLARALILKQQGKAKESEAIFKQAIALAPARYKDQIAQLAQGDGSAVSPLPPVSNVLTPSQPATPAKPAAAAKPLQ